MTTFRRHPTLLIALFSLALGLAGGCGDDGKDGKDDGRGSPEQTGSECETTDDCFPDVEHTELSGEVQCLDRVRFGYCTHTCETDDDCCAVEGECETDLRQVCSPFENSTVKRCFLSCEPEDLRRSDGGTEPIDEMEFCQNEASTDFICRSSGGGAGNRKICVPGDCGVGASCADDTECAADLACNLDFEGGYCGARECTTDAMCPPDSVCVDEDGTGYCFRTCTTESDCSFCRGQELAAGCTDEVTFVEASGVRVCRPNRK